MCPGPYSFQCHFFCDAVWCIKWLGYWNRHSIQHWWLCLPLQKASSKDQGKDWYRQRVSVCQRLFTERYYQSQHAEQFWQILNCLWQFWPNHQHKKDWSDEPAGKSYVKPNIPIKGQWLKVIIPFLSLSSWTMRRTPDSQKRVQLLADSTGMFGIREESWRQPKSRYIVLSFLPSSFMSVKRGQLINGN